MTSGRSVHHEDGLMMWEPEVEVARQRFRDLSITEPPIQDSLQVESHSNRFHNRQPINVVAFSFNEPEYAKEEYLSDVSESNSVVFCHSGGNRVLNSSPEHIKPASSGRQGNVNPIFSATDSLPSYTTFFEIETRPSHTQLSDSGSDTEFLEKEKSPYNHKDSEACWPTSSTEYSHVANTAASDQFLSKSSVLLQKETPHEHIEFSDSDSTTEYLEREESPCVQKYVRSSTQNRTHSRRVSTRQRRDDTRRPLNFDWKEDIDTTDDEVVVSQCWSLPKTPMNSTESTTYTDSSERLLRIERDPNHQWNSEQRIILCILNRFYDGPECNYTIPAIFNHLTGLNLQAKKIHKQFHELCFYGPEVFREFRTVFKLPFACNERFSSIHRSIESAIRVLGVDIKRREREHSWKIGTAKNSKTPTTKEKFQRRLSSSRKRERLNRADQRTPVQEPVVIPENIIPSIENLHNRSPRPKFIPYSTVTPLSENEAVRPVIAFRVWGDASWGKYVASQGIVSRDFLGWKGPDINPPSVDDGGHTLMLQVKKHFEHEGGPSPWISVTTSLLDALKKAENMINPQMAIIDMRHHTFEQPNKVHHAKLIIGWLQKHNFRFHYRGTSEYIVFSNISEDAIINHFPRRDLYTLAETDPDCQKLMKVECFEPGKSTSSIAERLKQQNTILDVSVAKAMASITKLFRVDKFTLASLQAFLGALVDCFYPFPEDDPDEDLLAYVFAKELRSRIHSREDVMNACKFLYPDPVG